MEYLFFKFRALVKIITLYQNWLKIVWARLVPNKQGEIIYRLRNGIKIIVRKGNIVEGRVVDSTFLGEYYYPGFEIDARDTVIDIGAHIGSFTLLAASKVPEGKVFAFEPAAYNFSQLKKNIKLNELKNVEIFKAAVFGKSGDVNLYPSEASSAHFSLFLNNPKFEKVKAVTLTDIFKKFKIKICHFLKIDAEGAEFEILTSTPGSVLRLVDKIVFEFHPRRNAPRNLDKILATCKKNNFRVINATQERIFFLKRI